jgi:alkylation response protein AidB-like acyl-CoA dehydrogenase
MMRLISELRSDEAEMLSSSIKEWAEREILPYRHEIDDCYEIAERAMKELFIDIGMQKLVVPETLGGAGVGSGELAPIILQSLEEIGKADVGVGFVLSATLATSISALGSEVFEWLAERLAKDFCIISIVPPQFGGNEFKGLKLLKAVESGDAVRLKGLARPLNSGVDASVFAVFCNYKGTSIAFVDGDDVERENVIRSAGLAASRNADIKIDTVVEKSKIVTGGAWLILKTWFNLCVSSICVGSAIDSYRIVKEWSERRSIRGKLLKDNTVDAAVLADVAREIIEARSIAQILAKMLCEDRSAEELYTLSTITALKCSQSSFRASDRAMELMASQGYAREGNLEKHWRDVKSVLALLNEQHSLLEIAEKFYGSEMW